MTRRRHISLTSIAAAFLLALAVPAFSQLTAEKIRKGLTEKAAFLPADLEALDRGDVVVLAQQSSNKQEVAVTGVVLMKGLPEISMQAFRASLAQKSNKAKTQGGRFGTPPAIADLQQFELSEKDLEDLKKCRVGGCDLNLSAEAIERFQSEIDWNAPDHPERATALMREIVIAYVQGYMLKGDKGLGSLANRRKPVDLAAAHRELLENSLFIEDTDPAFYEYLAAFPAGTLSDSEGEFSWSTVDFGLKPMVALSHSVAHTFADGNGPQQVLAAKQFYANHYLDSSIAFTFLLRVNGPQGPETYLVFTDRSRSDALDGLLGDFTRKVVTNEALERVRNVLNNARTRLETAAAAENEPAPEPEPGVIDRVKKWAQEPIVILALLSVAALAAYRLSRARSNRQR